ncbi:hypothetical protein Dimus_010329 [Dionaea muscipula]
MAACFSKSSILLFSKQILQREPTVADVFLRTHRRDDGGEGTFVDLRSKATYETFVRLLDEALASEGGESSSEITRKVWLEAIGRPKRGGKIYPFGNQGGALGLVPKGSSGVPSFFMHSQMLESFESMVLQLEEVNTMNNWLKEQLTASAQHEQRMHEYYTSAISTVFTELGLAMTPAPPPRSIPEPPSFSTHVHHRDPLNAPSTSQSNAHDDDDDDASLEESQED